MSGLSGGPTAGPAPTLVAKEPLRSSPSDIDVDARRRTWVGEVLNDRGKKETGPEADRVLMLEDTTATAPSTASRGLAAEPMLSSFCCH